MSKKALLAGVLPFLSNPVVLAAAGIGAVGWVVYDIFSDKGEEATKSDNGSKTAPYGEEPSPEPIEYWSSTVPETAEHTQVTVEAMVEETAKPTVKEPFSLLSVSGDDTVQEEQESISEEYQKKEMIRKAMSELGKRSAAARAKKKTKSSI